MERLQLKPLPGGPFEFDPASGELRKHGYKVKLPSQPGQILGALVECPAEVVAREELRDRLWPGATAGDFEHGLNAAVNKLRQALGDAASQPRYVETLPGVGYRFVAPVRLSADGVVLELVPAATTSKPAAPPRREISPWTGAVAALFDVAGRRVTAEPKAIARRVPSFGFTCAADFSVSQRGVLAYQSYVNRSQFIWVENARANRRLMDHSQLHAGFIAAHSAAC